MLLKCVTHLQLPLLHRSNGALYLFDVLLREFIGNVLQERRTSRTDDYYRFLTFEEVTCLVASRLAVRT